MTDRVEVSPEVQAGAVMIVREIVQHQFNSIVDNDWTGEARLKPVLPGILHGVAKSPLARKCLLQMLEEEKRNQVRRGETESVESLKRRRDNYERECDEIRAKRVKPATQTRQLRSAQLRHDMYAAPIQAKLDATRALLARPTLVRDVVPN